MGFEGTYISLDGSHHLKEGKPLYQDRYETVQSFHDPGIAPVKDENGWFFIDLNGNRLYGKKFIEAFGFYDGLAAVRDETGYHHIDLNGDQAYERRFQWVGNFQEEVCTVKDEKGSYIHISKKGEPIYESKYRYAGDFKYGIAVIYDQDGLAYHIDNMGKKISEKGYLELQPFHKGYAIARDDNGYFHIDRNGKPAYDHRFEWIEPFYNGRSFGKRKEGPLVLIEENGNVTEVIYQDRPKLDRNWISDRLIGYWDTQIMRSLVELEVFDKIENGNNSLEDLEKSLGIPRKSFQIIIDIMRVWGFVEEEKGSILLTERGKILTENHPQSMKYAAQMWADEQYLTLRFLTEALRTHIPQFERIHGKGIFQYYSENSGKGMVYQKGMKQYQLDYSDLIEKFDFGKYSSIVDVGGGSGNLLKKILEKYPSIKTGTFFDLSGVVEVSKDISNHSKLHFQEGDFFKDRIQDNDCVIMSRVLHDWSDEHCTEILKNCNESLPDGGCLVLFEMVMPEKPMIDMGVRLNFNLLTMVGGRERKISEFEHLFKESNFTLKEVLEGETVISLIIAEKIK